jgi:hypothetical protein
MNAEATMTTPIAPTLRSFLSRVAVAFVIVLFFVLASRAGGPKYVSGTTFFNSPGQPLTWALGQVTYFTDQGDLSPLLPNASANTFVANAFSQWTSVSTTALTATSGGQLAEDVNGSNVIRNLDGTLTMPTDIQPTASTTPVGIVYDADGTVTDALIGSGAGGASQCFFNAAFGGVDNFSASANFQHALVVINGQCAQQSSQLPDVEYRLVRVLGSILGLGWSQVNLNSVTGQPHPTADDLAGFPVMHYADEFSCVPITICYPNPFRLAMDDVVAISRLYPVVTANQPSAGKVVFASTTARIHGSVWFTDSSGNPTQPMQGANVIARWVDPITGLASHKYSASSVSGFLFAGDAGNPITGFSGPLGKPFTNWGAASPTVEGFFDLAGLEFPNGASSGQYQLSIEALDPTWSAGVGPYAPMQVVPSGAPQPIAVTVTPGADVAHDIAMRGSAQPVPAWAASETWAAPTAVPLAGDWVGSLNGYGDSAYFSLPAQANRTLSVAVTALDEAQAPSEVKAQPVVGMWTLGDPAGTPPPAFTPSPFNTASWGLTRLDAQIFTSTNFLIGIADLRGDGRPDYRYHAHLLYGDSVSPPRVSAAGGVVTVQGFGFSRGLSVTVGSANVVPLAASSGSLLLAVPAQADGPQNITISDPVSGASSVMTGAFTYGAAASDNIVLVQGSNPRTPVGTQANNPIIVRVFAADGVTPVAGATIGWTTTTSATLSACAGASACSVTTDESGLASTWVTAGAAGVATITATLAPGVYSPPKSVSATLVGSSSALDLGVLNPQMWIAQGATLTVPLTARVLGNGTPQNGTAVNFTIVSGAGNLSAASAQTNPNGYATVTLTLTKFSALVQISACAAPANNPCQAFYANPVDPALENLQLVSGDAQLTTPGQPFQPLVVRVTDSSSPPNMVLAASVAFQVTVLRPAGNSPAGGAGGDRSGNPAMPVILSVSQSTAQSDSNGLASVLPSAGAFSPQLEVDVLVTAGANASLQSVSEALPSP